jgi:sugar phosphate isomerase/epimerase
MLESASVGAFLNITSCEPVRWEAELDGLDAIGVEHVELWLEYLPSPRELNVLTSLLRGRRTIMHGPFIGMSLATDWEALAAISLDRCHRAVEVAGVLGCEVVTLHAGAYGDFEPQAQAIRRLAERLGRFSRIPRPVITVENMPARTGASVESLAGADDLAALQMLSPQLNLTLDTGHCLQNAEDPAAVYMRFHETVRNIHLHDGRAGGKAHQALGTGDLDLVALLGSLQAKSYEGFVTIETLSREDLRSSLATLQAAGVSIKTVPNAA